MDYKPLFVKFSRLLNRAEKSDAISKDHLETTNKTALNETHSLVLTLLIEAALSCRGRDYDVVALEHSLKARDKRLFRPDVTLWRMGSAKHNLVGVLEYESPNSGDERIWTKDIENFHNFVRAPENPQNAPSDWIIMTTLPDHEVAKSEWKNWDYPNKSDPEFREMILNPSRFWYRQYKAEFDQHNACCFERCSLSLVNLTYRGLGIELTSDTKLKNAAWRV